MTRTILDSVLDNLEALEVFLKRIKGSGSGSDRALEICNNTISLVKNGRLSVDEKIMQCVRDAGGEYKSMFKLAQDINVSYSYVWSRINELEEQGYLILENKNQVGKPITVILNGT